MSSGCNSFVAILLRGASRIGRLAGGDDSGAARARLNLLNFLLFSYHLSLRYFNTKSAHFEAGIETVNGVFCCSYGRFLGSVWKLGPAPLGRGKAHEL